MIKKARQHQPATYKTPFVTLTSFAIIFLSVLLVSFLHQKNVQIKAEYAQVETTATESGDEVIFEDRKKKCKGKPRLNLGDKGQCVRKVQKKLNIQVTGRYNKKTKNRVKKFQKNNDIKPANGVMTKKTWKKMF